MNMPLLYILNIVLIGTEALIIAYIVNGFFVSKVSRIVFLLSLIGVWAVECALLAAISLSELSNASFVNSIVVVALFTIWLFFIFKPGILQSLFSVLLSVAYLYIADYFTLAIAMTATDNSAIFSEDPSAFYVLAFTARILAIFGAVLLRAALAKRFRGPSAARGSWLQILSYPAASLVISIILGVVLVHAPESSKLLLFCALLLLVSDILSAFLLDRIERQRQAVQDSLALRQNLRMASDQVQAPEAAHEQQRKLTHDFKNQLAVLRNMAGTDAPREDMTRYLDGILEETAPAGSYVDTHRLIANLLINQKMAEAKLRRVAFDAQLDDLSRFPLTDEALVVVLSNLLDNALEACERIPREDARRIVLKMRVSEASCLLSVENTAAAPVRIVRNAVQTSKGDPLEHGYGLKNVCSALDQAGAIYTLHYEPETSVFSFIAQLGAPSGTET